MKFNKKKYGPWALVTGAARGIGKAFAHEIASHGINIILVDVLKDELIQTAKEILVTFPIQVKTIHADLSNSLEIDHLLSECSSYSIGLFCCNHAMTQLFPDGKLRSWIDTPLADLQKMNSINISSSVMLIHHFAKKMVAYQRGGIIIISSGGSVSGAPYVAQYGATKAFLANLGEALWWELKHAQVDVMTVLPGLTNTEAVQKGLTPFGKRKLSMMAPNHVASLSLNALGKKLRFSPGLKNSLWIFILTRLLPKRLSISFFGRILPRCFNTISIK